MGTSSAIANEADKTSENDEGGEGGFEVISFNKIPNDQYCCPECASVPELLHVYCETNEIEIKCKDHGKRRMFIKDYFKSELKHLYNKSICSVCKKVQEDNPAMFQFCYDCRKIFCPDCGKKHNHQSFVNVNEVNNRCSRHYDKKSKFYCKKCDVNICHEDDDPKHKLKSIKDKKPDKVDIERIEKRNKFYRKEKKLLDCLIKLTDTVIETYKKSPHNYFHCLNVTRLADSIEGKKDNAEEKKLNTINIEYTVKQATAKVRLFGEEFVNKNKGKCVMTLGSGPEQELEEFYPNPAVGNIKVKLTEKETLTDLGYMFCDCTTLTAIPDFDKWEMGYVTNLSHLFNNCKSLETLPDISKWDTTEVTDLSYLFAGCSNLGGIPDLSDWKTCSVAYMNNMFHNCSSLNYLPDISKWDTSYVTYMTSMFENCTNLQQIPDLSRWEVRNVLDFSCMFKECTAIKSIPSFSRWDTSSAINMNSMFHNCSKVSKIPNISKWNLSKVTDISHMFDGCTRITSLPDLSGWITCSCENMNGLFNKCSSLTELPDLSKWITYKVKDMACMFCNCSSLNNIPDLSGWSTEEVKDMNHMFDGCKLIEELPDISGWNTSKVTNMGCMFYYCENLISLPNIEKWDISNVTYSNAMFDGCGALKKEDIPTKFV